MGNERLSTLPQTNPNPVICCNEDGEISWCNQATRHLASNLGLDVLSGLLPHEHNELIDRCIHREQDLLASVRVNTHDIRWTYIPSQQTVSLYGMDMSCYTAQENTGVASHAILDHFLTGVLIVDLDLQVLYRNNCAFRIISDSGALSFEGQYLVSSYSGISKQLISAVNSVTREGVSGDEAKHRILVVPSGAGGQTLEVMVVPQQESLCGQHLTTAIIFLFSPNHAVSSSTGVLRALYGLTEAEARLTAYLANGYSLHDSAAMLDVKIGTVRTQLNQIFRKTDTTRQSELVNRILTGPAVISTGSTN